MICWARIPHSHTKHRKNCKCCPFHSLFKGHYEWWGCCSQLPEKCSQCLIGYKSLGSFIQGVFSMSLSSLSSLLSLSSLTLLSSLSSLSSPSLYALSPLSSLSSLTLLSSLSSLSSLSKDLHCLHCLPECSMVRFFQKCVGVSELLTRPPIELSRSSQMDS